MSAPNGMPKATPPETRGDTAVTPNQNGEVVPLIQATIAPQQPGDTNDSWEELLESPVEPEPTDPSDNSEQSGENIFSQKTRWQKIENAAEGKRAALEAEEAAIAKGEGSSERVVELTKELARIYYENPLLTYDLEGLYAGFREDNDGDEEDTQTMYNEYLNWATMPNYIAVENDPPSLTGPVIRPNPIKNDKRLRAIRPPLIDIPDAVKIEMQALRKEELANSGGQIDPALLEPLPATDQQVQAQISKAFESLTPDEEADLKPEERKLRATVRARVKEIEEGIRAELKAEFETKKEESVGGATFSESDLGKEMEVIEDSPIAPETEPQNVATDAVAEQGIDVPASRDGEVEVAELKSEISEQNQQEKRELTKAESIVAEVVATNTPQRMMVEKLVEDLTPISHGELATYTSGEMQIRMLENPSSKGEMFIFHDPLSREYVSRETALELAGGQFNSIDSQTLAPSMLLVSEIVTRLSSPNLSQVQTIITRSRYGNQVSVNPAPQTMEGLLKLTSDYTSEGIEIVGFSTSGQDTMSLSEASTKLDQNIWRSQLGNVYQTQADRIAQTIHELPARNRIIRLSDIQSHNNQVIQKQTVPYTWDKWLELAASIDSNAASRTTTVEELPAAGGEAVAVEVATQEEAAPITRVSTLINEMKADGTRERTLQLSELQTLEEVTGQPEGVRTYQQGNLIVRTIPEIRSKGMGYINPDSKGDSSLAAHNIQLAITQLKGIKLNTVMPEQILIAEIATRLSKSDKLAQVHGIIVKSDGGNGNLLRIIPGPKSIEELNTLNETLLKQESTIVGIAIEGEDQVKLADLTMANGVGRATSEVIARVIGNIYSSQLARISKAIDKIDMFKQYDERLLADQAMLNADSYLKTVLPQNGVVDLWTKLNPSLHQNIVQQEVTPQKEQAPLPISAERQGIANALRDHFDSFQNDKPFENPANMSLTDITNGELLSTSEDGVETGADGDVYELGNELVVKLAKIKDFEQRTAALPATSDFKESATRHKAIGDTTGELGGMGEKFRAVVYYREITARILNPDDTVPIRGICVRSPNSDRIEIYPFNPRTPLYLENLNKKLISEGKMIAGIVMERYQERVMVGKQTDKDPAEQKRDIERIYEIQRNNARVGVINTDKPTFVRLRDGRIVMVDMSAAKFVTTESSQPLLSLLDTHMDEVQQNVSARVSAINDSVTGLNDKKIVVNGKLRADVEALNNKTQEDAKGKTPAEVELIASAASALRQQIQKNAEAELEKLYQQARSLEKERNELTEIAIQLSSAAKTYSRPDKLGTKELEAAVYSIPYALDQSGKIPSAIYSTVREFIEGKGRNTLDVGEYLDGLLNAVKNADVRREGGEPVPAASFKALFNDGGENAGGSGNSGQGVEKTAQSFEESVAMNNIPLNLIENSRNIGITDEINRYQLDGKTITIIKNPRSIGTGLLNPLPANPEQSFRESLDNAATQFKSIIEGRGIRSEQLLLQEIETRISAASDELKPVSWILVKPNNSVEETFEMVAGVESVEALKELYTKLLDEGKAIAGIIVDGEDEITAAQLGEIVSHENSFTNNLYYTQGERIADAYDEYNKLQAAHPNQYSNIGTTSTEFLRNFYTKIGAANIREIEKHLSTTEILAKSKRRIIEERERARVKPELDAYAAEILQGIDSRVATGSYLENPIQTTISDLKRGVEYTGGTSYVYELGDDYVIKLTRERISPHRESIYSMPKTDDFAEVARFYGELRASRALYEPIIHHTELASRVLSPHTTVPIKGVCVVGPAGGDVEIYPFEATEEYMQRLNSKLVQEGKSIVGMIMEKYKEPNLLTNNSTDQEKKDALIRAYQIQAENLSGGFVNTDKPGLVRLADGRTVMADLNVLNMVAQPAQSLVTDLYSQHRVATLDKIRSELRAIDQQIAVGGGEAIRTHYDRQQELKRYERELSLPFIGEEGTAKTLDQNGAVAITLPSGLFDPNPEDPVTIPIRWYQKFKEFIANSSSKGLTLEQIINGLVEVATGLDLAPEEERVKMSDLRRELIRFGEGSSWEYREFTTKP